MADKKVDPNKPIKKAEQSLTPQTTAGSVIAAGWAYGSSAYELLQELDSTIVALANIDFSDVPGCKDLKKEPGEDDDNANNLLIEGCSPFLDSISKAKEDPSFSNVAAAIISAVDFLLGADDVLPKCVEPQFRRFLSVVPIQYYLLLLLSKLAQEVADFDIIAKEVQTPCGTSLDEIKVFKERIPNYQIPLIPKLPYINIPSLTDILFKLVQELICTTLCITTTKVIRKVSPLLLESGEELKNALFGDEIVVLRKISILPYLTPAAFEGARKNNLIPNFPEISDEQIKQYIQKIQDRDDVGQEEFIFLFLGQAKCDIIRKVLDVEETGSIFKFKTDNQIISFFSYLGSFINFIEIFQDSRAEICPPDPCDLKPSDIQGILASVNDLCALLNPQLGLPPLPLGSLMDAAGVNDFIVDNTYESYKTIPTLNQSYQPYINLFYTQSIGVVDKILASAFGTEKTGSIINLIVASTGTELAELEVEFKIKLFKPVLTIKKINVVASDPELTFNTFNKAIQNYWLDDNQLDYKKNEIVVANLTFGEAESTKEKIGNVVRRFLESSYPFSVLRLVDVSNTGRIKENQDFEGYYSGWNINDSEKFASLGDEFYQKKNTGIQFEGYLKYTKPLIRQQLKSFQEESSVDVNDQQSLEENIQFGLLKRKFNI